MYWTYLLECDEDNSWYIGYTSDLRKRVTEHQTHQGARTTRRKQTWHIIYCEGYANKADAQGRERFLKSGSGRGFLKKQLKKLSGETAGNKLIISITANNSYDQKVQARFF